MLILLIYRMKMTYSGLPPLPSQQIWETFHIIHKNDQLIYFNREIESEKITLKIHKIQCPHVSCKKEKKKKMKRRRNTYIQ